MLSKGVQDKSSPQDNMRQVVNATQEEGAKVTQEQFRLLIGQMAELTKAIRRARSTCVEPYYSEDLEMMPGGRRDPILPNLTTPSTRSRVR